MKETQAQEHTRINRECAENLEAAQKRAKAAHTPGPWESRKGGTPGYSRIIAGNRHVATAWADARQDGAIVERLAHDANACLIAAAPDMLAALESCVSMLDAYTQGDHTGRPWLRLAELAIARAKGEA
jgi:hypothetical protein